MNIARKRNAKIIILKKSAEKRKSAAKKRRNAVRSPNVRITAAMMITAHAVGVKSLMLKTFLILRTKEALFLLSIR